MSVLIKGGRIVTAADDYVGDILVENGKVSLIGASLDVEAEKMIDAGGKYVIPGAIDPHTHMEMPFSAETHHSNIDYNLYEGTEVVGAPEVVLVRGQVIVEDDEPGAGRFVKRARFGEDLR